MVNAIMAMGKSLEMQITAEGIEQMEARAGNRHTAVTLLRAGFLVSRSLQTSYPGFSRVQHCRNMVIP